MIYEVSNFIPSDICRQIINYFESNGPVDFPNHDPFFKGRTLSFSDIHQCDTRKVFTIFEQMIVQKIAKLYPEESYIFSEFMNIVRWTPDDIAEQCEGTDYSMLPHRDDVDDLENENYLAQRHYSSICYLNDEYEGGKTVFPEYNLECTPKTGKALFFPSSCLHGVTTVTSGSRYTIASWFTRTPEFCHTW